MVIVPEMQRLREMLDEKGIRWEDASDAYITRTHFVVSGRRVSVVNGVGTYGGVFPGKNNAGLLEVWSTLTGKDPIGYLTADALAGMLFKEVE